MKNELPPANYTPEEIAQLEKSRTISDAELLKGGAEYSISEQGEKENLLISDNQKNLEKNSEEKSREAILFYGKIGQILEKRINADDIVHLMLVSGCGKYSGSTELTQEQADFLRSMRHIIKEYGEDPDDILSNRFNFAYFVDSHNDDLGNKLVSNLGARKTSDGWSLYNREDWDLFKGFNRFKDSN